MKLKIYDPVTVRFHGDVLNQLRTQDSFRTHYVYNTPPNQDGTYRMTFWELSVIVGEKLKYCYFARLFNGNIRIHSSYCGTLEIDITQRAMANLTPHGATHLMLNRWSNPLCKGDSLFFYFPANKIKKYVGGLEELMGIFGTHNALHISKPSVFVDNTIHLIMGL